MPREGRSLRSTTEYPRVLIGRTRVTVDGFCLRQFRSSSWALAPFGPTSEGTRAIETPEENLLRGMAHGA